MDRAPGRVEQYSHGARAVKKKPAVKINPVRRELLNNALVTIADNVMVMIVRTARSSNVKNSLDFSAAILDGEGQLVAQGLAVPVHLGSMMPALKGCLDYFGDDIAEGDMLVCNDPYSGCSHLNDVYMYKPVFAGGKRVDVIFHHRTNIGVDDCRAAALVFAELRQQRRRCGDRHGGQPRAEKLRDLHFMCIVRA